MPFVLDASVAICWLMPDERHPIAVAAWAKLNSDVVFAPSLWWLETRNILLVNERRGRLDEQKAAEALSLLAKLPVTLDDAFEESDLLRLCRVHRLTAYDAAYLELARRKSCALATLDATLAMAAEAESVELIDDTTTS